MSRKGNAMKYLDASWFLASVYPALASATYIFLFYSQKNGKVVDGCRKDCFHSTTEKNKVKLSL
jgi:hypothetical protein